MALSIIASLGVDIVVVGGIVLIVFFTLFSISQLSSRIKMYVTHLKLEGPVLPLRNTRTHTTVTTHRSQTIVPQPREPPNTTNAVTRVSISAFSYRECGNDENEDCIVCLRLLREGETVLQLPDCGHLFHQTCICPWLFTNSVCPVCRSPVNARLSVKVGTV